MGKINDKLVLEALENSGGYIAEAARSLGVQPSSVSRRIKRSKKLQDAVVEIVGRNQDLCESEMMKIIKDSKHPKQFLMIMFYLKCKGGYVESSKIEHSVDDNRPGVVFLAPPEKIKDDTE